MPYQTAGPITLQPGDIIAVGTDGIWEAANAAGEDFGRDRFWKVVAENANKTSREIFDAVVDAVTTFRAGAPQTDDITLVVVKVVDDDGNGATDS